MKTDLARLAVALCVLLAGSAAPGQCAPAAPPPKPPTAAELDQAIQAVTEDLHREGDENRRPALIQRLADMWVLRARLHSQAGQTDAAESAYEQSLALQPEHPLALVELGWLELDAGRPELARSRAETRLARAPDDPAALRLRGEILYRDSRLEDALADLTRAAAARPEDASLTQRIEKIRRELSVERNYRRADSSNFVLLFEGERDQALGRLLLDVLERQLSDLWREIDAPTTTPITVILYTNKEFHDTTGTGESVIGLYDGKVRLPVGGVTSATPALVHVVRHELTHALLHARSRGAAPRWLHEGLAQLLEPRDAAAVRRKLARELGEAGRLGLEPFSYPKSLSFVAWLDSRYSRGRLLWFVDLLAGKAAVDDAFRQAFGASRDELVEAWNQWLQQE